MSAKCNLLVSVSPQHKFEATDVKALGASQLLDRPCYSSWTDQFYLENKGKSILKVWGHADPKDAKRERERDREREKENTCAQERETWPFGSSFYMFFPLPGLPYVNWASQECSLSHLRSSLRTSDLLLFYFHGLFPSLSFSHRHFRLLFPILPT